ncbi:MAG: antifreeze protein [Armatimonadetes bacterium 55-13]|nr:SPFH domain-containing protein [Armatimonadota bacterium]ODU51843.1 MAG: antifreeze protein [bacterium SCN 57-13]OJU61656.1 MAG: antifreeze protein [Armatimonadetes bacterium 55-13]
MSLWDKIKGEFIDIIQWTDDTQDTMVYRFERYGNQIKNGAQLTVRESQVAVFVNEGQIADVFQPGMYTLSTENMPILSTLKGWKYGFNSPFVAEVYFVNTKRFTDLKWGTMNPIMMRDQDFGIVRVRAFGSYTISVKDASLFLKNVVGTDGEFTKDEIVGQIRNVIVSKFSDVLGNAKIPVLDLAGKYGEMGNFLVEQVQPSVDEYGLQLHQMLIENISLPPEVEEAIDKRSSMGAVGNLDNYMKFQAAQGIGQGGGTMSDMMGAGMGMVMAQNMANQMNQGGGGAAAAPPPIPQESSYHVAVNGAQTGPFTVSQLTQQAASGQLTRESLVWKQGMAAWTTAGEVPELSSVFGSVPPPLPPQ